LLFYNNYAIIPGVNYINGGIKMALNIDKELTVREYALRENSDYHAPYIPEFDFYYAVKNGEVEKVSKLCAEDFDKKGGFGKLCEDKLQNLKYHFAITAAMVARYCIEAGMEHETAYSLSDLYIQSCDRCTTPREISGLHRNMCMDYTKRMNDLRKDRVYSKQIVLCINYIYNNLHKKVSTAELAQHTGLSRSYLSRLFKKETGESITDYIIRRKIGAAKNMLKYSSYSLSQISETLAFSCQSYFTKIFKDCEGVTPKKYRDMFSFNTEISHKG
jgi:YesN/AraC family two-component response regulator